MDLGIGTAQFGLDYGVSNRNGRVTPDAARSILDYAGKSDIKYIDTAALYGGSEGVLGDSLPDPQPFRIVTKTVKATPGRPCLIANGFRESLQRLGQESIYGLLLHQPDDLLGQEGIEVWNELEKLKDLGLVAKIGVSVYDSQQLDRILERFSLDLVQVPLNVFDQRLLASGHLEKLKAGGTEIHVRSIFLQGLLLMEPETMPTYFNGWREKIRDYRRFLAAAGLGALEGALAFAAQLSQVDCVIIGVCSLSQLQEVLAGIRPNFGPVDFSRFALNDDPRLNPTNWRL